MWACLMMDESLLIFFTLDGPPSPTPHPQRKSILKCYKTLLILLLAVPQPWEFFLTMNFLSPPPPSRNPKLKVRIKEYKG
jgi:hypothetical protein